MRTMTYDNNQVDVTVIMSVRNCCEFVEEAVKSILEQTHSNFYFYIVDDFSDDDTYSIIQYLAGVDSRISIWKNMKNIGLAASLNMLISKTRTKYIARMDADDISLPMRLEKQYLRMEYGNIDLCGTWMRSLQKFGGRVLKFPETDEEIRAHMLFQTPFSHPTIMIRRAVFKFAQYNTNIKFSEDYDLWVRLSPYVKMSNIAEVYYLYRRHDRQVSNMRAREQWDEAAQIRIDYLDMKCICVTNEDKIIHSMIRYPVIPIDKDEILKYETWLIKLQGYYAHNTSMQITISKQWYAIAIRSSSFGLWMYKKYSRSVLVKPYGPGKIPRLELFLICLLRIRYKSKLFQLLEKISF